MLVDAHNRAFAFFGGSCRRGIYDNMKAAVRKIRRGGDRDWNERFLAMCGHHPVEPSACNPRSAWEKGQVESQVSYIRRRLLSPRLRGGSLGEINARLEAMCLEDAGRRRHPEAKGRSVLDAFEEERGSLAPFRGPFESFRAVQALATSTCLVPFDGNQCSVHVGAAGREVEILVRPDRIEIRRNGTTVAEHARSFAKGEAVHDILHCLPVLRRKPGAVRNGAPVKALKGNLGRMRDLLAGREGGGREFVKLLVAARDDGMEAAEAACAEALACGAASADLSRTSWRACGRRRRLRRSRFRSGSRWACRPPRTAHATTG